MKNHPPDPCLVHPLPQAPQFVGREAELEALRSCWLAGACGVVALVGLGGAGKTAIAARFLAELLGSTGRERPQGLFVWSFYQEPDAGRFLQVAYEYFAGADAEAVPARGAGLLHLLREALMEGGPHLLVLDGLERVQKQESDALGNYGQVEDPLLKGLLTRIAEGVGQTTALVTSRFPLTDLEPARNPGYRHLDVGGLSPPAAIALLRQHGVQGDDLALSKLVDGYGAHALTLDHLGSLIGHFLGGDPRRAPEAPALAEPGSDRQALRLARLLRAYEEHLPPAELALLCRLCLSHRSVSEEQLITLFLCSPPVHSRTARELDLPVPQEEIRGFNSEHDIILSTRIMVAEFLCSEPIAGPEETFRQNLIAAVEQVLEQHAATVDSDVEEIVHLYAGATLDAPSDRCPLSAADRECLDTLIPDYRELRDHPLLPFQQPHVELNTAFQALGWKKPDWRWIGDMNPDDLLRTFRRSQRNLHHFARKHFVLRRVRELCKLYQQKWTLAGPLATLDAAELHTVLASLAGRHLVLREADGSVSVHPAVRDHFGRLAASEASWHDLIREQLVTLVHKP